jgi:hypothetical protein
MQAGAGVVGYRSFDAADPEADGILAIAEGTVGCA